MPLIVETGLGLPTSNSYASLEEAEMYHADFGNEDWASASTADKESALVHATKAIDLLFGPDFLSVPLSSEQALLYPRFAVVINGSQIRRSTTIPKQLKDAVCEVALLKLNGVDVYTTPNNASRIRSESVSVSGVSIATSFAGGQVGARYSNFWKVELILRPLLRGGVNPSLWGL